MRVESVATTVSWIPSEVVGGPLRAGFDLGLSHYDEPPPAVLDHDALPALSAADRFRFAHALRVWAEIEDGRVVRAGYGDGGLVIGSTTVRVGPWRATVRAARLRPLRREPEHLPDGGVRLQQTCGGRTGFPLPRPVSRAPYVQWTAPVVWTTLAIVIGPDGAVASELAGASGFPRHWLYDDAGALVAKSGLADAAGWMDSAFGKGTPWGSQDSPALVAEAVSDLELGLSEEIMRGRRPQVRRLRPGATLTRQGEVGDELFLLLDGVLDVDVSGAVVGQVGPGTVLGERALLETGVRTATLRAVTPAVVAVAPAAAVDRDRLAALAVGHRREDEGQAV